MVRGEADTIAPGSADCPRWQLTIVLRDGQLSMLLGGSGGSRIPTAVLQVFLGVVDFGMNPQEAVDAPRFPHQWLPAESASSGASRQTHWPSARPRPRGPQ
jgi:gamma-glutamyltranspeptidase/glutathione hydrolase